MPTNDHGTYTIFRFLHSKPLKNWVFFFQNLILYYINWTFRNKLQWNYNKNTIQIIFIQVNAFKNVVCRLSTIFSGLAVLRLTVPSTERFVAKRQHQAALSPWQLGHCQGDNQGNDWWPWELHHCLDSFTVPLHSLTTGLPLTTHLPLVPHISVSELGQHWFR